MHALLLSLRAGDHFSCVPRSYGSYIIVTEVYARFLLECQIEELSHWPSQGPSQGHRVRHRVTGSITGSQGCSDSREPRVASGLHQAADGVFGRECGGADSHCPAYYRNLQNSTCMSFSLPL